MASRDDNQATTQKPSSSTAAETPGRPRFIEVTSADQIEILRRQVIALQRISSLGILASGVFHELNNTLTPIINYAKLGLRNEDPAYRERALAKIFDAGKRAAAIIGGMLSLSRPGHDPSHRAVEGEGEQEQEPPFLFGKEDLARQGRVDGIGVGDEHPLGPAR